MTEADKKLFDLAGLENLFSLAIIGMSKNAGKTTCLNHIIAGWKGSGQARPLALTSIGRDGEAEDILSGRTKPRIYVPAGTLIASAEGSLERSDVLLDILDLSDIRTAFGEVVICRALSDGYVELAGPGAAEEMATIAEMLHRHEPDCLFIIDGALSRRSQAGCGVSEAAILAVSAATSSIPEVLADKTAFALGLIHTPALCGYDLNRLCQALLDHPQARGIILNAEEEPELGQAIDLPSLIGYGQELSGMIAKNSDLVFLRGAVTDQVVAELLKVDHFSDLMMVVEDGTRLFLKPETIRKLKFRNINLAVLNALDVRLVCLNPTRANGQAVNAEPLLAALRQKISSIPVENFGPADR